MKFLKKNKNTARNYKSVDSNGLRKNNYYRSPKASISTSNDSLKSKEDENNKKKKLNFSSLVNAALVALGLALAVFATTLNSNPIVNVSGGENISFDVNEYSKLSKEALDSSLFNRSKILFKQQDFETKLKTSFQKLIQLRLMYLSEGDL
jgi:hypothetical protein